MTRESKESLILVSEERLKELLDNQVDSIAEVLGEVENRLSYRIYNGFKSEIRRWFEGYYDSK